MLMFDMFLFILMIIPSYYMKFHPLLLLLILTTYTLILSLKLNYFNSMYWYSYILYLVMVGGILILFLYLTSISNNELFTFNMKYFFKFLFKLILFMMIYFFLLNNMGFINFVIYFKFNELLNMMNLNNILLIDYKNLYMNMNIDMNIYLIIYLFIIMVISVLICMKNIYPLRQMIN